VFDVRDQVDHHVAVSAEQVEVGRDARQQRVEMALIAALADEISVRGVAGARRDQHQDRKIRPGGGSRQADQRPQRLRAPEAGEGFVGAAELLQHVAELDVRADVVGRELDRGLSP
jgi:hypothetical protein